MNVCHWSFRQIHPEVLRLEAEEDHVVLRDRHLRHLLVVLLEEPRSRRLVILEPRRHEIILEPVLVEKPVVQPPSRSSSSAPSPSRSSHHSPRPCESHCPCPGNECTRFQSVTPPHPSSTAAQSRSQAPPAAKAPPCRRAGRRRLLARSQFRQQRWRQHDLLHRDQVPLVKRPLPRQRPLQGRILLRQPHRLGDPRVLRSRQSRRSGIG